VSTHSRRAWDSPSCIQSIAHTWFGPVALLQSSRSLAIEAMDAFDVHAPAFTAKQHSDPSVAIAHPALGDLPDAFPQRRLLGAARAIKPP
jgi:hypothetical protein